MESDLTTYYNILEIPITASQQEILEAYKRMASKYHPSKDSSYENKFIQINNAYEKLFKEDIICPEDGYVLSNDELFGRNIKKNKDEYIKKTLQEFESCKMQ